jgi:hypothetical protein
MLDRKKFDIILFQLQCRFARLSLTIGRESEERNTNYRTTLFAAPMQSPFPHAR